MAASLLPDLPIQYADYAAWQRSRLTEEALAGPLSWWRERLAGTLPPLELPTDRPRPAVQTFRGARLSRTVPKAATEEARAWSRREGTTFFLVLLAAWNALLHRHTAQADLLLGIPVANRNRLEIEGLIGFFLNMVAQRTDASGDPALGELLLRVRDGFVSSLPYQEVPFEKVVEAVQPARDLGRAPIFQVQFSLQNTPSEPLALPGLTLRQLEVHNRTTKFDATVFLFDNPEGLTTTLEYNADLFDEATMGRLLGHWATLLAAAPGHAVTRLSELPLLTAAEAVQLRAEWNDPHARCPDGPPLHRLFESWVDRRPNAAAAVCDLDELTYRQLDERANRLAHRLRALGVGPEVRVGLSLDRSLDLLVGLLGILKAGGAYVPLDPSYPEERLAFLLQDALENTSSRGGGALSREAGEGWGGGSPIVVTRKLLQDSSHESAERLSVESDPAHLAYMIYTSGSTGTPKGVAVTHANVVRLLTAAQQRFAFGPDDVWTLFHSFAFDFSVWEIWGALAFGGRLVVVPRDTGRSPAAFLDLLATERVTVLNQTPSAFRQLVRADEEEGGADLSLRWVIFGGEALDLPSLAPWLARRGDTSPALINMYGITETTVHVTWRRVGAADLARPACSPIGLPLADLQVHLLDRLGDRLELVPVGVPGEICVGGAGLARGYLGLPERTAERFVPDPFAAEPGARLYRSGDLARRRPDGDLEYLGRIDQQVKVRGYRIEPGEIEAALLLYPGVREAVVVARGEAADRRLVAYVVPRHGSDTAVAAGALREHLAGRLPEPLVPAAFVSLERLPLTPSGKVDRRALPEPGDERPDLGAAFVPPRTRTERRLAAVWRDVLKVEQVGRQDSFFDLGGHSLLVTRLTSRLRVDLGVELPVSALFEAPTLAAFAARLEQLLPEAGDIAPAILPGPREGDLPLSFAQERLWFLDQLEPGSPFYNIAGAYRLTGDLDLPVLEEAFREVARRHDALRATFVAVDGQPVQRIAAEGGLELHFVDLAAEAEPEAGLRRLAAEEARAPFDLTAGPLLRVALARLAEREHAALLTLHHIAGDGWSLGVLVREVAAFYALGLGSLKEPGGGALSREAGEGWGGGAQAAEAPSPTLPRAGARERAPSALLKIAELGSAAPAPLPVQYTDYARWQREHLAGEVLEAELAWWREALAGAPTVLELPADRPRPPAQSFRGRHLPVRLPAALAGRVRALAREAGATPFMTLLAAFFTLLHRHTGREDLLVGSPVANRGRAEIEGLLGFFANTLVLRGRLEPGADGGEPSFLDVLARVRESSLGAFAHAEVPFERLVEELQPARDLSRSPLVQVLFAHLPEPPAAAVHLPGLTLEPLEVETGTAKFDLTLSLTESAGDLSGFLQVATDLFEAPTALRLLGHFRALLESATVDPERPLSELPLLSDAERHQALAWNDTAVDRPRSLTLHGLVLAQAARTPSAPALVFEGESLSYAELAARSGRLASRLRGMGVGPETPVAVCLQRSFELVVGLLAVLEAGGAFVPLDPSYPAERLAWMLADSGAPVLLARGEAPEWAESARVLDPAGSLEGEAPPVLRPVAPDTLAYVLYTSGSTGRPKGAMNTHRAIVNRLLWMQEAYGLTPADRVLQKTPASFDVSVWEFFWPLLTGAALVLARPDGHRDPAYLARLIAAEGVTTLHFVPSMLRAFLEEPGVRPAALRRVIASGEALPPDLERRFFDLLPGVELHNLYGPTEAAVDVTAWACDPEHPRSPVPIGRPIANVAIRVLGRFDRGLRPVPVGAAGELCIGGVALARGYRNRPDLTAERFVPDPFGRHGERLYRTGDLARHLADGTVEFLGRLDHQVKVRGVRVEPGEVEAAVARHPAVREAAVIPWEERPGETALAAYVALREPAPDDAELRAFLRAGLPEALVPSAFVRLDALPLTPSGKLDRRRLPAPGRREGASEAPRGPLEEALAALWADLLRLDRVGAGDSFFDLGGHSLLAARLLARVREAFGVELPLRAVFEAPTVAGLAARIEAERRLGTAPELPPIVPLPPGAEAPLSLGQERLWFLDRLQPGEPTYNLAAAIRLAGDLNVAALAAALGLAVRRHESLRATFPALPGAAGRPAQRIAPAPETAPLLPVLDLSGLPADRAAAEADRLTAAEAGRGFDLAAGPVLRTALLRLAPEEHRLLLTVHHIVSDGWSMGVLVSEVGEGYRAAVTGTSAALPKLPVRYADYAAWQRAWESGEALASRLAWWREALAGAPVLELPADRPRPAVRSGRGASLPVRYPAELASALRRAGGKSGATLFMTLLAGFQALLCRYSGQEDLTAGTPVAGRDRRELEPLVGFFVNTLPIRARLEGDPEAGELLGRLREAALGAYAHGEVPFARLVEELRPARATSHSPLFQVMLVLQNTPMPPLGLPGLTAERLPAPTGAAKFDLTLELTEGPDGLAGIVEHSTELFDAATVQRLCGHLRQVLEALASDSSARLWDLPLLDAEERAQVASTWEGERPEAGLVPAHDLFRRRAAEQPDALALDWAEGTLRYGELELRSANLAAHLIRCGVGPDRIAALVLDRSPEAVTAMLAVLTAGGAFLPIDPAYPRERIHTLLADSGASVVLTRASLLGLLGDVPDLTAPILCVDELPDASSSPGGGALSREAGEGWGGGVPSLENLAYVIYTSGSTGRPKGVQLTHRGLANLARAQLPVLGLRPGRRVLQFSSLSFDASVWEILLSLAAGAALVLAPREEMLPGPSLVRLLREREVDLVTLPPSALTAMPVEPLPGLRTLAAAGEALPPELASRWGAGFVGGRRMVNAYGPTEITVCATAGEVEPGRAPSIGRPLSGVSTRVLDRRLRPVPFGIPGELCVGGEGVARGYRGRPDLTAERFVPDPESSALGARLYRTGDLARLRPDGDLEFLGRLDAQVKVRGFRVEPGEVEAALVAHPAVRHCAVASRSDGPGGPRLAAWFETVPEIPVPTPAELRTFLRGRLPEHMVPSVFVAVESLPRTTSGKVDRNALPPLSSSGEAGLLRGASAPPESELEKRLAAVWEAELGVSGIGVNDNFFDLGGHSLVLARVHGRLAEELGRDFPLVKLLENPTVGALAVYLESGQAGVAAEANRERAQRQRDALQARRRLQARRSRTNV